MKNKKIIIIIILLFLVIRYVPTGNKIYNGNADISFNVPNFSFLIDDCCMHSAQFYSLKSVGNLNNELKKILDKYEKTTCNNAIYYYNREKNFTITQYSVKKGFIFNEFYLSYINGNEALDHCPIKNDNKQL